MASLASYIDDRSVSDVATVVSELVTISIAHGAARPIEVSLDLDDGKLEGLLSDGPGARALGRAKERKDDSLVLRIVDGLVEDWGTNGEQAGVWFRMAVERI